VDDATRVWLYIRDDQTVRIVLHQGSVAIYGPGGAFSRQEHADVVAATMALSALECELVRDGWSLEQLTTERRSGGERRGEPREGERRRALRLVD
jgi:hypothetical protein